MELNFEFRPWQKEILENMGRFTALMIARRSGKSWFCVAFVVLKAILAEKGKREMFAYFANAYDQVEDIAWDLMVDFLKDFPGVTFNKRKLRIKFKHNGAQIALFSGKTIEQRRGLSLSGVVIDEAADATPDSYNKVLRPALADKLGWAMVVSTPKRANWFTELFYKWEQAREDGDTAYYARKMDVYEAAALLPQEIERERNEKSVADFAQEYLCDPDQDVSTTYYLELIHRADEQGRIGEFAYNPSFPVHCSFDLGRDGTSVWFFQLPAPNKIHLIDHWEYQNASMDRIFNMLHGKGYVYGIMVLPHDASQTKISQEESIAGLFKNQGFRLIGRDKGVLERSNVDEGIALAQQKLAICYFDKVKCAAGLQSLKDYRADVDKHTKIMLAKPKHDKSSHAADSFRYLVKSLNYLNPRRPRSEYILEADYDELDF